MSERSAGHDELPRDPALDRAYRAAAGDEPPVRLDEAIRAAARREIGTRPRPAGGGRLREWRVPVSIAAMMVVGATVVTLMREEQSALLESPASNVLSTAPARGTLPADTTRPAPVMDKAHGSMDATKASGAADLQRNGAVEEKGFQKSRPAREAITGKGPVAPEPGSVAGNVARLAAPAGRDGTAPMESASGLGSRAGGDGVAPDARSTEAPAPSPVPARSSAASTADPAAKASAAPRAETAVPGTPEPQARERSTVQAITARGAGNVTSSPSQPAPTPAPGAMARSTPGAGMQAQAADAGSEYASLDTPEKWVARLRELRRQNRIEVAAKTLAEFRKRYPDYVLPADLHDLQP